MNTDTNNAKPLLLLQQAFDALEATADSDIDDFGDEEEEAEAAPAQYACRKIMEAMDMLRADCWHDSKDFSVPRTDWKQVDEINTLREQVEKLKNRLNKDSQEFTILCAKETEKVLREQLAALAEQNEKMRKVLLRLACLGNGDQYGNSIGNCIAQEALSLPDLASPVLNRIRAEAMEEAAIQLAKESGK